MNAHPILNARHLIAMAATATIALLPACGGGGGGGGDVGGAGAADAQGLYLGDSSDGRGVVGLILADGGYYFIYTYPGSSVAAGVVQGQGGAADGRFTSADARDFSIEALEVHTGSVTATYSARDALQGQVDFSGGQALSFNTAYSSDWERTPTLAAVAGIYAGSVASADGTEGAQVTVAGDGALSARGDSGCTASGTLAPRDDGNAYDMTLVFGALPCTHAGETFRGIAYLDGDASRLYAAAPNADRSDGVLFIGTARK